MVVSICLNESKTIGKVLDSIPKKINGVSKIEKWVIDDGSFDNTVKIAKNHGAKIKSDGVSKGLAFRFREALDLAVQQKVDLMVNIDGDMQFNPLDIPNLVRPIIKNKADFVAADRFTHPVHGKPYRPENMPLGKYWGNKLGAKVLSRLSNQNFKDVTCGFRAYSKRAITALNLNGSHTYTQESFQVLAMKRMRILAVPVHVKYYPGRKSRVVTSVVKYVGNSTVNILRSYRDFAPLRFFGWLGLIPFILGAINGIFFTVHWILVGSFSPYKFIGFTSIYLITLGIIFWALGLVADMLSRMLNNQEKIIESIKRERFGHSQLKKKH